GRVPEPAPPATHSLPSRFPEGFREGIASTHEMSRPDPVPYYRQTQYCPERFRTPDCLWIAAPAGRLIRLRRLQLREVQTYCTVDVGARHTHRPAFVFADGFGQFVDVHGVTGSQEFGSGCGNPLAQVFGA